MLSGQDGASSGSDKIKRLPPVPSWNKTSWWVLVGSDNLKVLPPVPLSHDCANLKPVWLAHSQETNLLKAQQCKQFLTMRPGGSKHVGHIWLYKRNP